MELLIILLIIQQLLEKKYINKNIKNLLMDSKSIEKKKKSESLDFSRSDCCIHRKFFPKFENISLLSKLLLLFFEVLFDV